MPSLFVAAGCAVFLWALSFWWFGVAAVARPSAYTPTNVTTDRAFDANATSIDEIADCLGTLIAYLQSLGLVS